MINGVIFNLLTWFLLTIMSARFSIDEIKRVCVKVQFKLIILHTVCQEWHSHDTEYVKSCCLIQIGSNFS